jgi:hypothetical protein
LSAFETVPGDTPASAATSRMPAQPSGSDFPELRVS